jgi:hypothetical protein
MLAAMEALLAGDPPRPSVTYVFQRSEMWQRAVADEASADERDGSRAIEREALLDELRLDGTYGDARRAGLLRWAALRECDRQGLVETPGGRQAAEAALRNRFATYRRRDIDQWLVENELDDSGRAQLIADEARLRQLEHALGPLFATEIVAHLRAIGQYPRYASRARAKAQVLARTGTDSEQVDGLTRLRLAVWYFEHRLGDRIPDDLEGYAVSRGFADTDAFTRALWREYHYLTSGTAGEPNGLGAATSRAIES